MIRAFLLLLILICLIQPAAAAPRSSDLGIIDLTAITLLHPDMRYHIADFNLYLRPVQFVDPAEIALEAQRRDEAMNAGVLMAEAEIDRLERRRLLIRRHLAAIEEEAEQARRNLKPEYARLYALADPRERDEGLDRIKQELRTIDDAAALRRGTGENELNRAEDAVRRARANVFLINYLDGTEAASLEIRIRREVNQALDLVCRRERIKTVLDVSALRPRPEMDVQKLVDRFWRTPASHWSELFIISQEEIDFSEKPVQEDVLDDFRFRLRERLTALDQEKWPRLDQLLIRGGQDITAAVLDQLLETRKVDQARRKVIVDVIQQYRSGKGNTE